MFESNDDDVPLSHRIAKKKTDDDEDDIPLISRLTALAENPSPTAVIQLNDDDEAAASPSGATIRRLRGSHQERPAKKRKPELIWTGKEPVDDERASLPETPISMRSSVGSCASPLADYFGTPAAIPPKASTREEDGNELENPDETLERYEKELNRLAHQVEAGWKGLDAERIVLDRARRSHEKQTQVVNDTRTKLSELQELERTAVADKKQLDRVKEDLTERRKRLACDRCQAELALRQVQLDGLKALQDDGEEDEEKKLREQAAQSHLETLEKRLSALDGRLEGLERLTREAEESRLGAVQLLQLNGNELSSAEESLQSLAAMLAKKVDLMARKKAEQEARILDYSRLGERIASLQYRTAEAELAVKEKDLLHRAGLD